MDEMAGEKKWIRRMMWNRFPFFGNNMLLRVDGKDYEVDVSLQSQRLASATPTQRQNFVVSPSGYGIHWPDLDEDLSVYGLIGVRHSSPFQEKTAQNHLRRHFSRCL
jgi:hypothetical protein